MIRKFVNTLAVGALVMVLAACRDDGSGNPFRSAAAQISATQTLGTSVAFRFGSDADEGVSDADEGVSDVDEGVRMYRLPTLEEVTWRFQTRGLTAAQVIGFAPDDDIIYVRTPDSTLLGLELVSGRAQALDSNVALAVLGPNNRPYTIRGDGTLGMVVDGRVRLWPGTLEVVPAAIWGTTGNRLVAAFHQDGETTIGVLSADWDGLTNPIGNGMLRTSRWGDLVVVGTDSGVVAIDPHDPADREFVRTRSPVTALTFSASAHRVFVATERPQLEIINRFDLKVLDRESLPSRVEQIRVDRLGSLLLMRPAGAADSIWISPVTDPTDFTVVRGSWDDELPHVAPDGTVLIRDGDVVRAVDPTTGEETGRVEGGATDAWVSLSWDPKRPTLQLASQPQATSTPRSDRTYYAQLSSTANGSWAEDEANNLRAAGLPARVLPPSEEYDRYRVAVGPYSTHEEADDNGRKLGRPYFVISESVAN